MTTGRTGAAQAADLARELEDAERRGSEANESLEQQVA
jgi:hypothetical protein